MAQINLEVASSTDFKRFLDSFDVVLCDCDGVLWNGICTFDGVKDSLTVLTKLGKSIKFVTNNTVHALNNFHKKICSVHKVPIQDVITPTIALIEHLKQNNVTKKIFVVGTTQMKQEFTNAGFEVVEDLDLPVEENFCGLMDIVDDTKEDVGAVICDYDLNLSYSTLTKAGLYLQRPDVLFLSGATDTSFSISGKDLIGPGYFINILEDLCRRKSVSLGKPEKQLNVYLQRRFGIEDYSRTLFIGDSLEQDMCFASRCGYKKLLVLTGKTKRSELSTSLHPDLSPDFYISELGNLHKLIALHKL